MTIEMFHSIELQVPFCRVILEEGAEFSLDWKLGSSHELTAAEVRDGVLYFQCRQRWPAALLFWKDLDNYVRVTWPAGTGLRSVRAGAASGAVQIRQANAQRLEVKCASGALSLSGITADAAFLHVVSGGMELRDSGLGTLEFNGTSGKAELSGISAGAAHLGTVSGGILLQSCGIGRLDAASTSGGIRLENIAANGLTCEAVSGSIRVSGELRGEIQLRAVSGSVTLESSVPSEEYAWELSSVSGSKRVNGQKSEVCARPGAPNRIHAHTTSGSIHLTFQG